MACIILHNICELRGELFTLPDDAAERDEHAQSEGHADGTVIENVQGANVQGANQIRDALCTYFDENRL